jgi:hypothetical protein
VIKSLKVIALVELVSELLCMGWIVYGEVIFYSDQNTCSWESKHSFAYIIMFLLLTFGMILIFKWVLKALEVICQVVRLIKLGCRRLRQRLAARRRRRQRQRRRNGGGPDVVNSSN